MSAMYRMEGVIKHVQTVMAHLPVPVSLDSHSWVMDKHACVSCVQSTTYLAASLALTRQIKYHVWSCKHVSHTVARLHMNTNAQTHVADNPCDPRVVNCEHFCTSNGDSIFECSCRTGYVLDDDGFTCNGNVFNTSSMEWSETSQRLWISHSHFARTIPSDINECLTSNGGCAGTCTNTEGFFQCSCPAQSQLASDQLNCEG